MDYNQKSTEESESGAPAPSSPQPEVFSATHRHGKSSSKRLLKVLAVLIVFVGFAAGGWWYHQNQLSKKDAEIQKLQSDVDSLSAKLTQDLQASDEGKRVEVVTDANRETISEAVKNKSYGDLTSFFGEKVTIILAASEGLGSRTPTQAVEDLAYLNNATAPWDFELDDATLSSYAEGDYALYFPEDALVGKSANNYVVSFSFNSTGKINTIFITPDAEML